MRAFLISCLAVMAIALPISGADAAPQALGLIASNGAVPLHCADGTCSAELSSFCLQQERPVPSAGTPYRALADSGLTLVVTTADGDTRRLDAGRHLRLVTTRNYTAVTASLSARALAELGAVSAGLQVGEGAALVPVPLAGDRQPQSVEDLAVAVETRRGAGTQLVDRDEKAAAAGALNLVVNALSPDAHDSVTSRSALWRDTVGRSRNDADSHGLTRAAHDYHICHAKAWRDSDAALRWCLQLRHDALIIELNSDYWASIKTGS